MANDPRIFLGVTTLAGLEKKGINPPDEYGYYTQPVGALRCYNEHGVFYRDDARVLFNESTDLMRRVKDHCLKGEEGHPEPTPGMSDDDWVARMLKIEETRICVHLDELWLDDTYTDRKGRPIIAIMAKVKGSGAFGEALDRSLANPREEVCFSVRAFSEEFMIGITKHRIIQEIVTFDRVTEPGIGIARKFWSHTCESLTGKTISFPQTTVRQEKTVSLNMVRNVVARQQDMAKRQGVAMESMGFITPKQLFDMMGRTYEPQHLRPGLTWSSTSR